MVNITLFTGFHTSQVVQDLFRQQYDNTSIGNAVPPIFWGVEFNFQVNFSGNSIFNFKFNSTISLLEGWISLLEGWISINPGEP